MPAHRTRETSLNKAPSQSIAVHNRVVAGIATSRQGRQRAANDNDNMGFIMGHRPRILLCEHDNTLNSRLLATLEQAGFWVDAVHTPHEALQKLATRHYQAMTVNLLLRDQDALSFTHELRVLGMQLPILVLSATSQPKRIPQLMNNLDVDLPLVDELPHPEPDWVRKAADQARAIFAVKSACQRSRGFRPRILHIEADAFSAGLVKAALRGSAELIQAGDAAALDAALDDPDFDLVLFNSDLTDIDRDATLHRIAAMCPDTPVAIQTCCTATESTYTDTAITDQHGSAYLVTALRTLLLHAMQLPLRAQA